MLYDGVPACQICVNSKLYLLNVDSKSTCLLLLVRCMQCIKYLAVCERPQGEACQVSLPFRVELGRQQIRGHPVFPPGVVFHSLPEVQLDVETLTLHNETHQASSLRM